MGELYGHFALLEMEVSASTASFLGFGDADSLFLRLSYCDNLGAGGAETALDRTIVCDDTVDKYDRHWRNFGIICNVDMLEHLSAPLLDCGSSLWSSCPFKELVARRSHDWRSDRSRDSQYDQLTI